LAIPYIACDINTNGEKFKMANVCEICGKGTVFGRSYATRGLARRKNGAGITGFQGEVLNPTL
jgi:hypothetical protein